MGTSDGLSDLERLIELQAIFDLKARRDHAVDQKDWDLYAKLHTDDYVAMSISDKPIIGGRAAADALATHLANVTTVHHCHTPASNFRTATMPPAYGRWRITFSGIATAKSNGCAGSDFIAKPM